MIFTAPLERAGTTWGPGKHRKSLSAFRISTLHFSVAKSGYQFHQNQSEALRTGPLINPF